MRKAGSKYFFSLLLLAFFLTPEVNAAQSSVSIKNSVNTSNSTSSNSNCKTEVRIESNGEVKEYNSQNCESVNMESSDGKSSVKINNNSATASNSNPTNTSTPKPTKSPTPTLDEDSQEVDAATQTAKKKIEQVKDEQNDLLKLLQAWIKVFFESLF